MKQLHTFYEFCRMAIVGNIDEYTDLLKRLWENVENLSIGFISEREADSNAMALISDYVTKNFLLTIDFINPIADIFYDIYKVFVRGYKGMELHCQNLNESDMDSTLCGMVRDYFHF